MTDVAERSDHRTEQTTKEDAITISPLKTKTVSLLPKKSRSNGPVFRNGSEITDPEGLTMPGSTSVIR